MGLHGAPVTVRRAEQRDVAALGRLGAMLMKTHYALDRQRFLAPGDSSERGYASFLGSVLNHEDGCVLVAEHNGEIAGYIYVELEPMSWKELRGPAGFVHDVAVREESRNSGIAELLMRAGIDWLRERGVPRVILWTAAQNDAAQRLFHRLGFRDTMIEMTMDLEP